jgi:hypothetical protein
LQSTHWILMVRPMLAPTPEDLLSRPSPEGPTSSATATLQAQKTQIMSKQTHHYKQYRRNSPNPQQNVSLRFSSLSQTRLSVAKAAVSYGLTGRSPIPMCMYSYPEPLPDKSSWPVQWAVGRFPTPKNKFRLPTKGQIHFLLAFKTIKKPDCRSSTGEGKPPYCFAFEGIVRIEILARGVEIRMSHEVLDRDDIAAFFKKSRCVRMSEFMQSSMLDASTLRDSLKSSQQVSLMAAYCARK